MKKGVVSILAGALVVGGGQKYDCHCNNLESQISALASTVAGLTQVQSDLSALAGTVASLSSTVNSLGDTIDTAVADGLTDIQADIDAIESAVADVASSEEVSALSDAVATAQSDLTDLLDASSVFTGDVVVNSTTTLDAFHKMGAALAIVNGEVKITVSTDMDQAKVQELVDNIKTVVEDFKYEAAASSIAETTFNELTGTRSLTIKQGGGMRFPNLISATNIYLKDDFESTVDVIHFGSLTSVTSFNTDSSADTIEFTKATELHLTSLVYYPSGSLTIVTDEGAAMPFALDDVDADGDTLEDGLTLDITGPASFAVSNIADGSITLTDVATVNLTDFKGSVSIAGDVESFTSNSLVSLTVAASTKLETVDVTGAKDPDATTAAPSYGPAISLSSLGDLETVTIAGDVASVSLSTNNNLTDVTISAAVDGAITIDNNSDLTNVTLTGAKAAALDVDTNADLVNLVVDLTWQADASAKGKLDGDLDVTDNASLESLTVSSDNLEDLTVTGNDALTTMDFTGVEKIGATGKPDVDIWDNDLTATKSVDTSDGATNVADGKAGDLGSFTTTSGIDTLKKYLTAVAADTDSAANVYFDTVESYTNESDSESTDILYTSNTAENATTILLLVANTADLGDVATTTKRSYLIPNTITSMGIVANGVGIIGANPVSTTNSATLQTSNAATVGALINETSLAQADIAGVSISATSFGAPWAAIELGKNDTNAQNSATAVSATGFVFGVSDTFTVTMDGLSATVTYTGYSAAGGTKATKLANAVMTAWSAKYGNPGKVASETALRWTLTSDTTNNSSITNDGSADVRLKFTAKDKGTGSIGAALTAVFTSGKTATYSNVGYVIGNANNTTISTGDDVAQGTAVILTVEADSAGSLLGEIGVPLKTSATTVNNLAVFWAGTGYVSELNSTYNPNITASNVTTAANIYPEESRRNDVVIGAEANAAATSNAKSYNRVSWL